MLSVAGSKLVLGNVLVFTSDFLKLHTYIALNEIRVHQQALKVRKSEWSFFLFYYLIFCWIQCIWHVTRGLWYLNRYYFYRNKSLTNSKEMKSINHELDGVSGGRWAGRKELCDGSWTKARGLPLCRGSPRHHIQICHLFKCWAFGTKNCSLLNLIGLPHWRSRVSPKIS